MKHFSVLAAIVLAFSVQSLIADEAPAAAAPAKSAPSTTHLQLDLNTVEPMPADQMRQILERDQRRVEMIQQRVQKGRELQLEESAKKDTEEQPKKDAASSRTNLDLSRMRSISPDQMKRIVARDRARLDAMNQRVNEAKEQAEAEKKAAENPSVLTPGKTPEGWLDNYDTAVSQAQKEKKPILALFTGSDWCRFCAALETNVLSTKEFKDYAGANLVLLYVDFPRKVKLPEDRKAQNDKLAKQFSVLGYPTAILLASDGRTSLWSNSGYSIQFLKELKTAAEKAKSPAPKPEEVKKPAVPQSK